METATAAPPPVSTDILDHLSDANRAFAASYPGEPHTRQPVHTVYGGAQIFKADTAPKLGGVALAALKEYAPDFVTFAKALGLRGSDQLPKSAAQVASLTKKLDANPDAVKSRSPSAWLAHTVYERVVAKLRDEPVEDFRID